MSADSPGIWRQAAELFDELAPLAPAERRAMLASRDVSPQVRQWLEELLAAHDGDRTTIIDREIDRLVEGMVPEAWGAGNGEERLIGRYFGPWRTTRKLGHGGMGLVLAGERSDGQFEMNVAIKLLDPTAFGPSLNEQFRREVRFLAELSHPGVAQLLDGGVTDDGIPYLVMEYIDGRPVDRFCREEQPDFDARLAMFLRIAEAVDHCHRHLVVHCDIKPANVLVDRDGQVRLLDFGIASRLVSDKAAGPDRSRVRWCSPGFAAPERLEGAPPTVSEDIFALGALLYLLLTGAGIRSAPEMTRLLQGEPVKEVPPRPSERAAARGASRRTAKRIRGDLDAIVMRSLATQPEARYRSVRALLDDLDCRRQGMPVSARPPSRRYRLACWLGRHRVTAVAGLAVFASLLAGTGIAVWQADQAREQAHLAEQSLAETEQALRRVTGLRDFIVDLFDTVEPDRPRDELPSTREILRAGRERVLAGSDLAAGERFELLYTLGRIHESLFLREAATELLESAVALARQHEALHGKDLTLALRRLAWAVGGRGDLERAAALFNEALAQARSAGAEKLEVQVAADRAYLMLAAGEVDAGLQRLERLEQRLETAEQPDPKLEFAVMGPLGTAYSMKGELEASIAAKHKAVRAAMAAYGPDGNRYAMTLANLANVRASLGQLPAAKAELERAVDAYDRIFADGPSETRAAAITNLARTNARLGDFERALEQMRIGSAEWARSMNQAPRQRPQFHQDLAWVLTRARRWDPALERLQRAEALLREQSSTAEDELARSMFMQGMILCRQGHAKRGTAMLDSATDLLEGDGFEPDHLEADRLEAIASCRLARGEWRGAIEAVERARARTQPGWVLQNVELFLTAGRAGRAAFGAPTAQAQLDSARAYLGDLPIASEHPAYTWIDRFERRAGFE